MIVVLGGAVGVVLAGPLGGLIGCLAPIAHHVDPRRLIEHLHVDAALLGERPRPLQRTVHDGGDVDRLAHRRLTQLDARQLHQVVDRPGDTVRLGDHPF